MKALLYLVIVHLCYLAKADIQVEIPDLDDYAVIKEKCNQLGGNGTYDKLKEAKDQIQTCMQGFVDVTVLKNEIEESKKTGSMDEVFGKYCAKRPKVAGCLENFTSALRPCLNEEEKKALNVTLDILKQLGEFVCFRDGDRIAMFIAEGGVECIKGHTEGIKNCVNSTLKISPTVSNNPLPSLLMDKKKCDDLAKLQTCVVEELEKCKDSTPANIVDALFRFIKRSACSNKSKRSIHKIIKRNLVLANQLYNAEEIKNKILKIFKEKCKVNAPEGGYEAFTDAIDPAIKCYKNYTMKNAVLTVSAEDYKSHFQQCFRDLAEKATQCLSDDEKYYPQFYINQLLNVIDWFYANKNNIISQASRLEIMNCLQNFKQENAKNEMMKCIQPNEGTMGNYEKKLVCSKLETFKTCFTKQIQKTCIQDVNIVKLSDGFSAALVAPCL